MNKLSMDKQMVIISALVEGVSIRSIERMTGVHRDTIMRLMVRVGDGCQRLMDKKMRNLPCQHLQLDEIWCYVGKKQRHVKDTDDPNTVGDFYTWVAIDSTTKLIPSFKVGKRDAETGQAFVDDLADRLANRVQISSDGLNIYVDAVERSFGADVDYAQIVKFYEAEPIGPGRYSPLKVVKVEKSYMTGRPDLNIASTSYVERQNLTMRMSMRRFTRLTNAYSKKLANLKATVALHFAHYNFVRVHHTLKYTPAMEAGVVSALWTMGDLVEVATSN
jgi:IS1 family transposase